MEGLVSVAARMSGPARILNYHMLAVARSNQYLDGCLMSTHPGGPHRFLPNLERGGHARAP